MWKRDQQDGIISRSSLIHQELERKSVRENCISTRITKFNVGLNGSGLMLSSVQMARSTRQVTEARPAPVPDKSGASRPAARCSTAIKYTRDFAIRSRAGRR